ncbi:MAG: FecR domain-containing protein [Deltaproteobacteria bacterium]|nr:FecR domain-containing protein [Deltaproteobacteria bacterium]
MSETPNRVDEFSARERAALDAWPVLSPSSDFAGRVMGRVEREKIEVEPDRRRNVRGRRVVAGAFAAAAMIAAAVAVVVLVPGESVGRREVFVRETISIGDRVVAVAEPNATLEWRLNARGVGEVVQSRGNIFYRVGKGGDFVVRTPAGTVHVVGTCFRVEVNEMTNRKATLTGASVGAVLAATVIVTLYEGRVTATTNRGAVTLEAGQSAVLASDKAPSVLAAAGSGAGARLGAGAVAEAGAGAGAGAGAAAVVDGGAAALREKKLVAEIAKLQREIEAIKAGGESALEKQKLKRKSYDLPKEELLEMAKKCELRWDVPSYHRREPTKFSKKDAERLGIRDHERAAIDDVFKKAHERTWSEIEKIYRDLTDGGEGHVNAAVMQQVIESRADPEEVRRVYHKLAQERAGLAVPPQDSSQAPPYERLMRFVTSLGDAVEREIGERIGPDLAKEARGAQDGWGSRSSSSNRCPDAKER